MNTVMIPKNPKLFYSIHTKVGFKSSRFNLLLLLIWVLIFFSISSIPVGTAKSLCSSTPLHRKRFKSKLPMFRNSWKIGLLESPKNHENSFEYIFEDSRKFPLQWQAVWGDMYRNWAPGLSRWTSFRRHEGHFHGWVPPPLGTCYEPGTDGNNT